MPPLHLFGSGGSREVKMDKCLATINGHQYELDLEPTEFEIWPDRNTWGRPCLVLVWRRETQFPNIVFLRMLIFHLSPPWITYNTAVTDRNEPVEEEK